MFLGIAMGSNNDIAKALGRVSKILEGGVRASNIVHTASLKRSDRELLCKSNWLQEITRGWYLLTKPDLQPGDSSSWYANFWDFLHEYLQHFYGTDYCLSAEHSLDLHIGSTTIPKQVIVMAPKGRGAPLLLPYETSLLIYSTGKENLPTDKSTCLQLQTMSLAYALCKVSNSYFQKSPTNAQIALRAVKEPDVLLRTIIKYNFVRAGGRLIAAYKFINCPEVAQTISEGLSKVNIKFQEQNPFVIEKPLPVTLINYSPYYMRIIALWQLHRDEIIRLLPEPSININKDNYIAKIDEQYIQDAYNSLSIEGYKVTNELIEKIKYENWDPEYNLEDKQQRDTLAARGYYEAHILVKTTIGQILEGKNSGDIIKIELSKWYAGLFGPSARAGIIDTSDLFGYRQQPVYIKNSRHTPVSVSGLLDAMEAFFRCLQTEENAGVRAILGHFIFVFIHPYMDGNGRLGRFIMNVMFITGGYPWTVIKTQHRNEYMRALEEASCNNNITELVNFIVSQMNN